MRVAQRFLSLLQNFSGPFLRFFHGEKVIFHLSYINFISIPGRASRKTRAL